MYFIPKWITGRFGFEPGLYASELLCCISPWMDGAIVKSKK